VLITDFLDSWSLFATTYLAGWLIAVLLSVVGVWVVARNQIFLGAAVAQASTLGVAGALWMGGVGAAAGVSWLESELLTPLLAVAASVATALLTAREAKPGRESPEAVTGWVYLAAASLPVVLLANSPHGLEEVHKLIFSTILGASRTDLYVLAILTASTCALVTWLHPRLLLFALDPEMAAATGMQRLRWNAAVALWLGVAVGLSIRVSGTLYTFGCLVLPALVAKNMLREIRPILVVAPLVALVATVLGFVLAHAFDVPPAHASVTLLCLALLASWAGRYARG
jgi:ABC-type Mn2+/Zn2+ transport system permease subunit